MSWKVLKFGGSSITKIGFDNIIDRIKKIKELEENVQIMIVLSAKKNVTNLLINKNYDIVKNIHNDFMNELDLNQDSKEIINKLYDFKKSNRSIISLGEILSTSIFYEYLNSKVTNRLTTKLLYSTNFIKSKENFKDDAELYLSSEYYVDECILNAFLSYNSIYICQGFIGSTPDNRVCLMGRGGSDTTASLIANALNADCVEIWTDVNGMYTADPNKIKNSKIIEKINYDQAQELAAMGAKVLHPYCIIPCKLKNIPIFIRNTYDPYSKQVTHIMNYNLNKTYAVTDQHNITVFNIESINMWNNYGFVYDIFKKFSKYSIDVNIITTSQFIISTTTDCSNKELLKNVFNELSEIYKVEIIYNCSIISIVGDSIKNKNISKALSISKKYDIHMIHHSSNDLTLSFVVNKEDSIDLLKELHNNLIITDNTFTNDYVNLDETWWSPKINEISSIMNKYTSIYLYDLSFIKNQILFLKETLPSIDQIYYSMKANNNINILKKIAEEDIGFECVSYNEVDYLRNKLKINNKIIFTPNFCNIEEYEKCLEEDNIIIIVDNIEILKNNINIFKNKDIGLRVDLNTGEGHNVKVITEGNSAKFGSTISDIICNIKVLNQHNINIIGLHSHRGSGIQDYNSWVNTAKKLLELSKKFNNIKWLDLGGGFGVNNDDPINFNKLDEKLTLLKNNNNINLFIEPGRFIVSEGGVLISKVTQVKVKDTINYIGIDTGMNSLIRPTLYDSYHKIHNLSKIYEEKTKIYNIVGPICETGDYLGNNRLLQNTEINDIILIENAGAYGHVMSTNYNMRTPAIEIGL